MTHQPTEAARSHSRDLPPPTPIHAGQARAASIQERRTASPGRGQLRWALLSATLLVVLTPQVAWAHVPHDVIGDIDLALLGRSSFLLFVIAREALLRSSNGGRRWKNLVRGLDNRGRLRRVAISPHYHDDATVLLSTDGDGIYKSDNGGDTWRSSRAGLDTMGIEHLAWCPYPGLERCVLAAGTRGGLFRSENAGDRWRRVGELHTTITALGFVPDRTGRVLAGDRFGQIWRSVDLGASWSPLGRIPGRSIRAIASSPDYASDGTVFVGTEGRPRQGIAALYVTRDDGASFAPVGLPVDDEGITALALSPRFASDRVVLACTWRTGVHRSRDGGITWEIRDQGLSTELESRLGRPRPDFRRLALSPEFADDGTVYLAGFNGLSVSVDGGCNWSSLETISVRYVDGLAVSPAHAGDTTLAINTYGAGIYRSDDRGRSWVARNTGLPALRGLDIAFSPGYANDRTLFAACRCGDATVVKSEDGGASWIAGRLAESGRRGLGGRLASARWVPRRVRWVLGQHQCFEPLVLAISPDYCRDATVFAGGMNGCIYRSTDGGRTYKLVRRGGLRGAIKCLVVSPDFARDRTLFASIGNFDTSRISTTLLGVSIRTKDRVIRSTDGGATWSRVDRGLPRHWGLGIRLAISPDYANDRTLFAATAEGLFHTTDRGATWILIGECAGLDRGAYVESVAVSPGFRADREVLISMKGHGLFRSNDAGEHFVPIAERLIEANHSLAYMMGFPGFSAPLRYSPTYVEDDTIYGTSTEEVFVSTDRGRSWTLLERPTRYEDSYHNHKVLSFDGPGPWTVHRGEHHSMGSVTSSDAAGSRATVRFFGTGFALVGTTGPDRGIVRLRVDEEPPHELDLYGPEHRYETTVASNRGLPLAAHTVILEVTGAHHPESTGRRIDIDAVDVFP